MKKLIERVKAILLKPNETWIEIKAEEATVNKIYKEYLVLLAIVPSVAGFLGSLFLGNNFFRSLLWGVLYYGLSLLGVWAVVKLLSFLATNFKIEHDEITIYKLVAYAFTPILLAGIFFLIPPLSWLSLTGIYGFFLLNLGIAKLLECPKNEQFNFSIVSILSIVLVLIVIFSISGLITGVNVSYLRVQ